MEQEADTGYNEILGEVGLEMVGGQAVPSSKIAGKQEAKMDISDMEKKLAALKN